MFSIGLTEWVLAAFLAVGFSARTWAQNFRITETRLVPPGAIEIEHETVPGTYSILYWGTSLSNIATPVRVMLNTDAGNVSRSVVTRPTAGLAFFRIRAVPLAQPLDSDGDGVDDVFELRHPPLDPLNPRDVLTHIRESSPAHSETGVAVTRETVFRLTRPLARDTLITASRLSAQFGGRPLLARIELSTDRRTVTLFYLEPLPGSAQIQVTFDGNGLRDESGLEVDLDGNGTPGGVAKLVFQSLSLTPSPGTAVSGRVFASELAQAQAAVNGDLVNRPLAGARISVDGREQDLFTVTDGNGNFRLDPAPVGPFFVHIDGRTVVVPDGGYPQGPYYPSVGKEWVSRIGEETRIGNIYLPLIEKDTLQAVSAVQDTTITFVDTVLREFPELAGVRLVVPANALFKNDGTRGGLVGIAPVAPDRLPSPLPPGLNLPLVITVQTDGGENFDRPVPVCFPNPPHPVTREAAPPGAKGTLWSFNHDLGDWEMVGPMTVSEDGKLMCSDPGFGILQPGWHGAAPPGQGPETVARDGSTVNGETKARECPGQCPTSTARSPELAKDDCPADSSCEFGKNTVILHNGEERFERSDLSIPGRGQIHFVMQRTYRSRLSYNGPLGFGWTFSYNEGLYIQPNGDASRFNGRGRIATWVRQADGSFIAPTGDFRSLSQQPDGTYVLRSVDGFQSFYRADGLLFCQQDRFGNRMLFDYDGRGNLHRVIDAYGREIEFTFVPFSDGVDRLVRITDFAGREVVYSYDSNGDLVAVRTPIVTGTSTGNDFPSGRTERYTYSQGFAHPDLNHNLLSVTLPEEVARGGPPYLRWTYGTDPSNPMTFDAVLTETVGGTNATGIAAGGTTTFTYEGLNADVPPGNPEVPRGRATITLRNGTRWEYYANELDHHIITRHMTQGMRPGEPAYYETRSYFDADGQLVRRVFPAGNEVQYAYATTGSRGQRQNIIEVRRVAGPRGGGEDQVTTFTYEPLFNQVASITDPRGNAAGYVPPLGAASANRYTTRFYYDYQESNQPVDLATLFGIDLSSVPRGLGDLNGDGRTNQVYGNRVRVTAPSVQLPPDSREAALIGSTTQQIVTETQWNDRGQPIATMDPEGNVTELHYYPENDPDGDGRSHLAPYAVLSEEPTGYLGSVVADARASPRRRPSAPVPLSLETRFAYDAVGNTIAIRNPRGVVTEIEVNPLNEIVRVTRGADVSEAVRIGQLLENETPRRYLTQHYYDFNGRVIRTEVENRDSNTEGVGPFIEQTFTYDLLGNLLQRTAEIDATTTATWQHRYDPEQLPVLTIQPEGNRDAITYDERNLPFRITRGAETPVASTIQVDYDLNGSRRRVLDAEDNDGNGQPEAVEFTYDGFDRLTRVTDPLGNHSISTFDVANNVVRVQAFGHPPNQPSAASVRLSETVFRHDELGRVFQTDAALFVSPGFNPARPPVLHDQNNDGFVTTRTEYDALSRSTFAIEDDLEFTRRLYDGVGRVIESIDALGNRHRTAYDRNSNAVRSESVEVSPEGLVPDEVFTTVYVYDQLDRLTRATDNAGHTARFGYDSRDNLVHGSDPEGPMTVDPLGLFPHGINGPGNTHRYFHDGLGRMIRQVGDLRVGGTGGGALDTTNPYNPDGQITLAYEFDRNSRLTGIVDDNGNRTRFGFDAMDRKVSHTFADGESYLYEYDRDSNVRRVTDPNGSVITKAYDALNRVLECNVARAAGVEGTTRETFAYDGLSRLVRSTDDNGNAATSLQTVEYVYDSLGRTLEERQNGRAISSRFLGDGRRAQIIYPGGRTITRTFDAIDRIKQLSDGPRVLAATDWIGPGRRELLRLNGNGTMLTFLNNEEDRDIGYDAVRRLVRLRVLDAAGAPLVDREYAYNRASQRMGERRHDEAGLTDRYTYDSTYRVIASAYDVDGLPGTATRDLEAIGYRYDGVGNRREVVKSNRTAGAAVEGYLVNPVNEYTEVAGLAQASDDNGNLTDDGRRLMVYDYKNRLVRVAEKGTGRPVAGYEYLADGRRAKKTVYSPTVPGLIERRTAFFCDGVQEVEEQDGMSGATETTFVWSPVYVDELVEYENALGSFYMHQNARCDVVAVTDAVGDVVEGMRYDDFGRATLLGPAGEQRVESAVGNVYRFQGRRHDPETGLLYFRARYYVFETGRFLQRDPVWDSINAGGQYSFVGNAPLTRKDPLGLQSGSDGIDRPVPTATTFWGGFREYIFGPPAPTPSKPLSQPANPASPPPGGITPTDVGEFALDAATNYKLLADSKRCVKLGWYTGGWEGGAYITAGMVGMVAGGLDAILNWASLGLKGAVTKIAKEVGEEAAEALIKKFGKEGAERIFEEGGYKALKDAAKQAARESSASAAARGIAKGAEHIDEVGDSVAARRRAADLSGLGERSIEYTSEVGPQTGWVVGKQSEDGLRGWRLDFDEAKGFHVNWWDRTCGKKRQDWLYGAVKIKDGTWHDYIELLKHAFGNPPRPSSF